MKSANELVASSGRRTVSTFCTHTFHMNQLPPPGFWVSEKARLSFCKRSRPGFRNLVNLVILVILVNLEHGQIPACFLSANLRISFRSILCFIGVLWNFIPPHVRSEENAKWHFARILFI